MKFGVLVSVTNVWLVIILSIFNIKHDTPIGIILLILILYNIIAGICGYYEELN